MCLLAGVTLCGVALHLRTTTSPRGLESPDRVVDLGSVPQRVTVDVEFTVSNVSDSLVTIDEVISSCSCSKATFDEASLRPSESVTIKASWSSGTGRGPKESTLNVIYAFGDDPQQRFSLPLNIRATVEPEFYYDPGEINFAAGRPGVSTISFSGMPELHLTTAYVTQRGFAAAIEGQTVTVTFEPDNWVADRTMPTLVVHTDSEKEPHVRIPIVVQ